MQHLVDPKVIKPGGVTRMIPVTKTPLAVADAVAQVDKDPDWNRYTLRTKQYGTTHSQVSDLWIRFNAWKNYNPKKPSQFLKAHRSVWYPAYARLPAIKPLIFGLMTVFAGEELGGVLITRIPPGCRVEKHRDGGFNAEYYNRKFAIMLKSNAEQAFCFDGEKMITEPGDVFQFDNSFEHWVTNQSDEERMTLIVSLRTSA